MAREATAAAGGRVVACLRPRVADHPQHARPRSRWRYKCEAGAGLSKLIYAAGEYAVIRRLDESSARHSRRRRLVRGWRRFYATALWDAPPPPASARLAVTQTDAASAPLPALGSRSGLESVAAAAVAAPFARGCSAAH